MYGKTNAGASTGGSNNGIEMVKLWENASPTSEFAPQTITVNGLNNYDAYLVIGYESIESAMQVSTIVRSGRGRLYHNMNWRQSRPFTIKPTSNQVLFDEGFNGAPGEYATADNGSMIPVAIYGIKGVS